MKRVRVVVRPVDEGMWEAATESNSVKARGSSPAEAVGKIILENPNHLGAVVYSADAATVVAMQLD
ncbi:MAG: hypothetical protein KW793_02445 [Candidatus Doudnabacteria bacterium]|nr:hypothetical protein [Candidatus Doudnabacteria bacterium]